MSLGMMTELTGVVKREAMEAVLFARVPAAFKDLNKKAFELGFEEGEGAEGQDVGQATA